MTVSSFLTTRTWLVLGAGSLLALSGCSDDGGAENSDATGGVSGAGAGSETGGASSGAGGTTSVGGGTATGGSELPGEHCVGIEDANPYGWVMSNCGDGVRDIDLTELAQYVELGSTVAFTVEMTTSESTMELWGTNEECGEPQELLDTKPMGFGVFCMQGALQQTPYTHLLWDWQGGGSHAAVTWCDSGTCP